MFENFEDDDNNKANAHPPNLHIKLKHEKQRYNWDCGIACLKMVLPPKPRQHLTKNLLPISLDYGFFGSTWTIDLCLLLKKYEIAHTFYTTTLGVHPGYNEHRFYAHVLTKDEQRVNRLFDQAEQLGLSVKCQRVSLSDIVAHLIHGPIIVLINANLLSCDECKLNKLRSELRKCLPWPVPYQGHFIVLCGYEMKRQRILYRNPSFADRVCFMSLDSLEEARKSYGTDEDIIFIRNTLSS